ncbi:putative leader peptide [Streptomyces sp. NPDC014776]
MTAVHGSPHAVRLHTRPHIDLLRVAGALCSA